MVPITITFAGDSESYSFGEEDVVLKILELATHGSLHRLKTCKHIGCEKWFYARVRHQHFCSFKCQQVHFRSSPESKHKRKLYMRTYRKDENDRNRQADAGR